MIRPCQPGPCDGLSAGVDSHPEAVGSSVLEQARGHPACGRTGSNTFATAATDDTSLPTRFTNTLPQHPRTI